MDVATLIDDPHLSGIMEVMAKGMNCDIGEARERFLTFFCVAHGLASLLANNSMEYDEERSMITDWIYMAATIVIAIVYCLYLKRLPDIEEE